jgi:diguanylate cyclase (GGDEF)-like protein
MPLEVTLNNWTGQFLNKSLELDYARHVLSSTVRLLRTSLGIIAIMFTLLALVDFHMAEDTGNLRILLANRVLFGLCSLGLIIALGRNPSLVYSPYPLNFVLLLLVVANILLVPLRPETVESQISGIITVTLTIYLFIPNRIPWMIIQNTILAIGFLISICLVLEPSLTRVLVVALVLVLPNIIGYLTILRLNKLQRLQYYSLVTEQKTNQRLTAEINERFRIEAELRRLAQIDDLTGLNNRRWFMELAEQELRHAKRLRTSLAIGMVDLDHFKKVNDTWGHVSGDQVLKDMAQLCRQELREVDMIGRFGGEEFVIALPITSPTDAQIIAERIRTRIKAHRFTGELADLHLTVTIGISTVQAKDTDLGPALLRADRALYDGKHAGRDRVVIA